jgi:hypothetical protein
MVAEPALCSVCYIILLQNIVMQVVVYFCWWQESKIVVLIDHIAVLESVKTKFCDYVALFY